MKKKKQETLYGLLWKQLTPSQPNLVHFASIKVFFMKIKDSKYVYVNYAMVFKPTQNSVSITVRIKNFMNENIFQWYYWEGIKK